MQIDNTVLEKLEKLSHLRIDDSKKEEVMQQLTGILTYIENLNELDTEALSPTFSTLDGGTPGDRSILFVCGQQIVFSSYS